MFDSHCHLHDVSVGDRADAWLREGRLAGVSGALLAGVDPADWREQEGLVRRHADLWMSFGIHPQIVAGATLEQCSAAFEELNAVVGGKPERLVAIGEIGLDAATPERKRTRPLQEDLFRQQLALARAHELPVVLHILRAHGPALALLRRDGLPQAGGVVHSYSGPLELVRDYTALGLYISFATSILGDRARRQHGAAAVVPRDRLLVETDAPFQAPPDVHPEANRPAVLPRVVDRVAKLRGEHSQDVAAYTALNARRLFRL